MSQFNPRTLRFAALSCLLLACENSTFHGASKSAAQADQPMVATASTADQVDDVHQYDDKFQTTGVDYFHMLDAAFLAVNQAVAAEKKFNIIVANSRLSPGAWLAINGKIFLASDWESKETQSFNDTNNRQSNLDNQPRPEGCQNR